MNGAPARRPAALTGIALTAALALWWLGSSRLALDDGADASRPAADALHALWLARAMVLALLSLRVAALHGWWAGASAGLALVAPAWPLLVLVWSASTVALLPALLNELVLLGTCLVLPLLGQALRKLLRPPAAAESAATLAGVALVAALWATRGLWTLGLAA